MTPGLLTLVTFVAALVTFFGVYSIVMDLYLRDRSRVVERISEEFRAGQAYRAEPSLAYRRRTGTARTGLAGKLEGFLDGIQRMLEQAGVHLSAAQLLGIAAAAAVIPALLILLLTHSFVAALILGTLGFMLPFIVVRVMRRRRQEKLLAQLPDAFDLIARVIRAGQTVPQAMRAVAKEFQAPLSSEFKQCSEQQDLGMPPELALRDLAERTGLLELQIFVVALLVQRQAGGNLAEILENLANIVRDRFRIRTKIKVLTSQGRLEAAVLVALPPLIFLAMLYLNPAYTLVLLDHPYPLVAVSIGMLLGMLWIRRIVRFDF